MISTILKTSALAAAMLAAGAAYAAPFDFFNGAPEPAVATSPPPFNALNGPAMAPDAGAMEHRAARRHLRHREY